MEKQIKDRRIRGCINTECEYFLNKKHLKIEENFCPMCGNKLVIVCAECHKPLNENINSRFCEECLEKYKSFEKAKEVGMEGAKKVGDVAKKLGEAAGPIAKKVVVKTGEGAKAGSKIVKKNAPIVFDGIVRLSKNPKVREITKNVAKTTFNSTRKVIKSPTLKKVISDAFNVIIK